MFDSAAVPTSPPAGPAWDAAGFYLYSPNAAHAWTPADVRAVGAWVRWLLPIYVYDPLGRDGSAGAAVLRAITQLRSMGGPNNGVAIALEVEERDAPHAHGTGFLAAWCAGLRAAGYVPVIYTSASVRGDVEGFEADLWLANWNGIAELIPGSAITQYKSPVSDPSTGVDWNVVADALALWPTHQGGTVPPSSPTLNAPIVAAVKSPSGQGYYLCASDGGVFTFGDAVFHGAAADHEAHTGAPIVAMMLTQTGAGYWLVGDDGAVYSFGDAHYHGGANTK